MAPYPPDDPERGTDEAPTSDSTTVVNPVQPKKRAPRKAKTQVTAAPGAPDEGLRNQKRMAHRFAQEYTGKFIYTPGRGWLEFNGAFWEECGESRPWNAVAEVCRKALRDLGSIERSDWRDELYEDVRRCDSANGTSGVLKHAMHWPGIGRRDEELDDRPDLFVVQNGTIDLRTGTFRESDPRDLLTLAGGCEYDPAAVCPLYDELVALYQPDEAIRGYLHRLGGAAMEGRQNLQNLIVHYGQTGGNGKGTTQRAWQNVFGTYAHTLPVEALIARKGYDQYKDEKAQLKGKRLVYLTEPSAGQRFDTGTVKSLTGGEAITSRAVYKASVTFTPTYLIMMSTNNRVSTPNDGGMARRLKEIGWNYTVSGEFHESAALGRRVHHTEIDGLLAGEASGILNRLLKGWIAYRDHGVQEPEKVKEATADYLASVDVISQFIEECVLPKEGSNAPSASVYKAYTEWCRDNGEHPMAAKLFSPDLEKRGYVKRRHGGGMVWLGISLIAREF